MKILHVINSLDTGGAEKLLVNFLPYLVKEGHEVELLQLTSSFSEKKYQEILIKNGVKIISLTHSKNLYSFSFIFKLRIFFKTRTYDIVHVHLFPALYWTAIALKKFNLKLVFTEHSTKNNRIHKFYFKPFDRFIYQRYDKIIAISYNIKNILSKWLGSDKKIIIVRNGVELAKFIQAIPYSKKELAQELRVDINSVLVLMVARFSFPKDQATLVEAAKLLPVNFHVLFVGEGDIEPIKALAKRKGIFANIHFLGFRNDIPQLIKSVDINVLSSLYEGMSGVTCEALASGKPFLGSDVSGINDVVPDGRFLFASGDAIELAEKIQNIVRNEELYIQMVGDGMKHVKQFDMSKMVEQHIQLYKQLIANNIEKT